MKSVEILFNEALEQLKKTATASKYNEVSEKFSQLPNIEAKLNCVEEALKTAVKESDPLGLGNLDEALSDPAVAILFGVEPRKALTNTESKPVVKKHNGALENFDESNPLQRAEGRSAPITETSIRKDIFAKGDAVLLESMTHPVTKEPITESEKRRLRGDRPAAYDSLNEVQKKEFDQARMFGISESDALVLARL